MHAPRLLVTDLVFPESPRWFGNRLWISDMFGRRILRLDVEGRIEATIDMTERPSGLGFLPDGTPLIVAMGSRRVLRYKNGELVLHADLSSCTNRINDMVVGPEGRAYVSGGTVGGADGSIILVEPDGTVHSAAQAIPRPNGMALVPSGETIVYAASDARCLMAVTVRADGILEDPRRFADLDGMYPDGICLDADGGAWVGTLGTGFLHVRSDGVIDDGVTIPGTLAVACALGGFERRTLFLTVAEGDLDELFAGGENAKGAVYSLAVAIPGAGWP